ncbi:protein of unknown function [Cupriavidus taiwanensis]|nr:protein of unknown function [Cupriavidus taiwanensis]
MLTRFLIMSLMKSGTSSLSSRLTWSSRTRSQRRYGRQLLLNPVPSGGQEHLWDASLGIHIVKVQRVIEDRAGRVSPFSGCNCAGPEPDVCWSRRTPEVALFRRRGMQDARLQKSTQTMRSIY